MGRPEVRAAVAEFFGPPAVERLTTAYGSQPGKIPGDAYYSGTVGSGAALWVFIERDREERIAIGGATSGVKKITYDVALVGEFRAAGIEADEAMDVYDGFVESIKAHARSDRTFGSDTLFQAGEGDDLGAPDLDLISDLPIVKGNSIRIWTALRFHIVEMIQS